MRGTSHYLTLPSYSSLLERVVKHVRAMVAVELHRRGVLAVRRQPVSRRTPLCTCTHHTDHSKRPTTNLSDGVVSIGA